MCIATVDEFLRTYGVPMQFHGSGDAIRLVSQHQDGDTFSCDFDVEASGQGYAWFNVCPKMYPTSVSVLCNSTDMCRILSSRSKGRFTVYPMDLRSSRVRVSISVKKRVLRPGARRSLDDQIHLNGALMHFEEEELEDHRVLNDVDSQSYGGEMVFGARNMDDRIAVAFPVKASTKREADLRIPKSLTPKSLLLSEWEELALTAAAILLLVLPLMV